MCTLEISFSRGLEDGWKKAEPRLGGCSSSQIEESCGPGLAATWPWEEEGMGRVEGGEEGGGAE